MYATVEGIFYSAIKYAILLTEGIGIVVLVWASVKTFIGLCKKKEHLRLEFAEGIALALGFKMGAELLRTVITREWEEIIILGAIILLRGAMVFLINWEIKIERREKAARRALADEEPIRAATIPQMEVV